MATEISPGVIPACIYVLQNNINKSGPNIYRNKTWSQVKAFPVTER